MPSRRRQPQDVIDGAKAEAEDASNADLEKRTDETDVYQISDDDAPEEVSAAAATALEGRRRKAEVEARKNVPKRKRARSSTKVRTAARGDDDNVDTELELPSDLLLKVKSGGLQRMKEEARELEEADNSGEIEASAELASARRATRTAKVADIPRSDNFRLVVLDGDKGVTHGDAVSKTHAAETAEEFLRNRMQKHNRVSHGVFKARRRLGPSPTFVLSKR